MTTTSLSFQQLSVVAQQRAVDAIVNNDNAAFEYALFLGDDEPVTPEHVRLFLEDEVSAHLRFDAAGNEV